MKKAWRTNWRGTVSICAAETRGKAIAKTLASIDEAGYLTHDNKRTIWREIKATRAQEFDKWAEVDSSDALWAAENLPQPKQEATA